MTYEEAREYIKAAGKEQPDFLEHRNLKKLLFALGSPEERLRFVYIAGSRGRRAVQRFISAILGQAGYCTGTVRLPLTEQPEMAVCADGEHISCKRYAEAVERIRQASDKLEQEGYDRPTEAQLEAAVIFLCLDRERCEITVVEASDDPVSEVLAVMINAVCSVFVPILPEEEHAGAADREEPAVRAAAAIRPGVPIVTGRQPESVMRVLAEEADHNNSNLRNVSLDRIVMVDDTQQPNLFEYKYHKNLKVWPDEQWQAENAAVAVETAELLGDWGFDISENAIRCGLEEVRSLTTDPTAQ